jgi:hypothetical protein
MGATAPAAGKRSGDAAGGEGAIAPGGAITGDEQRGAINRKIDDSLSAYDRRIRDIQDELNRQRDAAAGSEGLEGGAAGGGGGGAGSSGGVAGSASAGGSGGTSSAGGRSVGSSSASKSGGGKSAAGAGAGASGPVNVPTDVADGSDDDIVARQLREAAMKEKDPALRDKLWQEYRDYKKGT